MERRANEHDAVFLMKDGQQTQESCDQRYHQQDSYEESQHLSVHHTSRKDEASTSYSAGKRQRIHEEFPFFKICPLIQRQDLAGVNVSLLGVYPTESENAWTKWSISLLQRLKL
jgi:hypothetical protein